MSHLDAFLSVENPVPLSSAKAAEVEKHLASCERCADLVARSEPHREALLHAVKSEPRTEGAKPNTAVDKSHQELAVWARRAMARLAHNDIAELSSPVPSALQLEIPRLAETLDPAAYRIGLAVSEAALAIRSLALRSDRTCLHLDGSLELRTKSHSRPVPANYIAARIAQYINVPANTATRVWSVVAQLAVDGRMGIPGLAEVDRQARSAILVPIEVWSADTG